MNKILMMAAVLISLTACSTDNDNLVTNPGEAQNSLASKNISGACWDNFTAHYDNAGTFMYPKWNFIADVPAGTSATGDYIITLEVQETDGEDITVGYGTIMQFTDNVVYNNITVTPPAVARFPSELPLWYRWRVRVSKILPKIYNTVICTQVSPWYDTPLG